MVAIARSKASRMQLVARAALALLVASCGLAPMATSAIAAAPDRVAAPVERIGTTAEVVEREWQQTYVAEATVEAVRQTVIAAQVTGAIVALPVKAGDRVRAGDVLARIDARSSEQQLAALVSQVAEVEANLANVRRKHERNRDLARKGFVSQAAVDQSDAEQKAAEAQLAAARANASQAQTARSHTVVTAPYAGVIGSTDVQLGDMATPGRPLLTIFDPAQLRVTATVPQGVLAKVRSEAGVVIELPALEQELTALRSLVVPLADARSHTAQVRLDIAPVDGLLPGHYARARFVVGSTRAIAVPARAIVRRGELRAVYVVDGAGRPQLRQVRLGETLASAQGPVVQVLAGVRPGERVALDPIRAGATR
jgi:RND family efflux transporter MFP subunit